MRVWKTEWENERERTKETEKKNAWKKERVWESMRVSPWKGVRKIYNQSNLVKKKSIILSTLYHSVILMCLQRLSFLPHANYFCIEIVLSYPPSFLFYYFFLYFPVPDHIAFAGNRPLESRFLRLVKEKCLHYKINILTLSPSCWTM